MDARAGVREGCGAGQERRARSVPRHRALLLDRAHVGDADHELRALPVHRGRVDAELREIGAWELAFDGEVEPVDGDREDAALAGLGIEHTARVEALGQDDRMAFVAARGRLARPLGLLLEVQRFV